MLRVVRSSASRFLTTARLGTISPFASRFSSVRSISDAAPFQKVQIPMVDIDTKFDAYVVGKHDAPGIIVLQDWLGVDYHVKNHALRISQLGGGFKALIPDLYRGNAKQLFHGIDWVDCVMGIISTTKWLKTNGSKKVGVIGFCLGGALAIASSNLVRNLDAAVAFYGFPSSGHEDPALADSPLQAHFGELDNFVGFSDVKTAKKFVEELKMGESIEDPIAPYEVHIYPGVGHAFMNRSPEGIKRRNNMELPHDDEAAVQLAWSRVETWMTKYLAS
ncbi:uncharacterized protein LOC130720857 [Lotus japonicus]|uniref:uncharacterized protein LOC130720857 n=1 Tax=Lotus japonicus TaxID=34305 RepID=UPI00258625D5|nr:uncharacterized protein LOC130720857 [Lotus japonicus]